MPVEATNHAYCAEALCNFASFADLVSNILFKPITEPQIEGLASLDWASIAKINEELAFASNDIARYLAKRNSGTRQELAVDYTSSFGGMATWEGKYAVPCESVFTSEEGLLYQESYHDVYSLYRANGIARNEGFDYPDDHLGLMFEFLKMMATGAAEDIKKGAPEEALLKLELCRSFIEDHILNWFDDLTEIAANIVTTRFYRGVLHLSRGLALYGHELFSDCIAEITAEE